MDTLTNLTSALSQKVCSKCKVSKTVADFNFRYRATGERLPYCRECGKELTKSHYRRNKRQYIARSLRSNAKRREYMRQVKSCPCADCGVQYPYYVMDFDHREGEEKSFEMNRVSRVTLGALKKEIDKCDVVCANCHRERTYQRIMRRSHSSFGELATCA
jgi:hypothetical protein